jgi:hypothetical protein
MYNKVYERRKTLQITYSSEKGAKKNYSRYCSESALKNIKHDGHEKFCGVYASFLSHIQEN